MSKSQKYSEVKHPEAWRCHPAALLQGGRPLPQVGRREHFGDASDTQGAQAGRKRLGKQTEGGSQGLV